MPAPDSSTSPEHPHTEVDFAQGINLAQFDEVSGAQLEQLVREATVSARRALIVIQDDVPDVVNNPHLKRYAWVKTIDTNHSRWCLRFWQGPATDETGWVVGVPEFPAGSIPLVAINKSDGVIGYFLGINAKGVLAYLPIPARSDASGSITPGTIAPGTNWQFLLTGANTVAQWRNFADFATANPGVCPITILTPGPNSTVLSTNNVGDLVWTTPILTSGSQLLPSGAANGLTLGVASNVIQWVDGSYIAGIIPANSVAINKLKPVEGETPLAGSVVCWNGTMYFSCPLHQASDKQALPTASPYVLHAAHGGSAPPIYFSARLLCETADAGFSANMAVDYHSFYTGNNQIILYADNVNIYARIADSSGDTQVISPVDGSQNTIVPGRWKFQFIWT